MPKYLFICLTTLLYVLVCSTAIPAATAQSPTTVTCRLSNQASAKIVPVPEGYKAVSASMAMAVSTDKPTVLNICVGQQKLTQLVSKSATGHLELTDSLDSIPVSVTSDSPTASYSVLIEIRCEPASV